MPNLAQIKAPLRQLLRKDQSWIWDEAQATAFKKTQDLLASPPPHPPPPAHYSPQCKAIVAADASATGTGAVLTQVQDDGTKRPVSFISRSVNDAERNYAAFEKEALAATRAAERFRDYLLGLGFVIGTDHKPLVPFLNGTDVAQMPPGSHRFQLRLPRYNPTVTDACGKHQVTADALP